MRASRCEVQRRGISRICIVSGRNSPKTRDRNHTPGDVAEEILKTARHRIEACNPAATEVADQDAMAVRTEIARRNGHAPRRVEPASMLKVQQQVPVRRVDANLAQTSPHPARCCRF